jgi:hypothetical protein
MNEPVGALFDDAFLQGFLLLLATAAITGLLVPLIKGRIDDRKFREQKVFESALARQGKVIDSQAKLLEDLSQLLWAFLLLSLEVTYYAEQSDSEKFAIAWQKYDETAWDYFGRIRAEISKARRLTSDPTYEALLSVYNTWFMDFDLDLTRMARASTLDDSEWSVLHGRIYNEGVASVDGVLVDLASELQLTGRDARSPQAGAE